MAVRGQREAVGNVVTLLVIPAAGLVRQECESCMADRHRFSPLWKIAEATNSFCIRNGKGQPLEM
jgi:hypothetical protein